MRISKKFAGQCIGKHAFVKRSDSAHLDLKLQKPQDIVLVRDSDSPSGSTSSSASSDTSILTHCDSIKNKDVFHADSSFGTLAEFQLLSYTQTAGTYPRYLIPVSQQNSHPTMLYPVTSFAAPVTPWAHEDHYFPVLPAEFTTQNVGLDIDEVFDSAKGLHTVSADHSSRLSSPNQRSVDLQGRTTPTITPGLVSPQLHFYSASAGGYHPFVTPPTVHFLPSAPIPAPSPSVMYVRAEKDAMEVNHRACEAEAEEWRMVLSYITQSQSRPSSQGPCACDCDCGAPSEKTDQEVQMRAGLVRRDSSFLLHRSVSYSSLFV